MLDLVQFPKEIIDLILGDESLKQEDLAQCQLVNKQWRYHARAYCYRHITLYSYNSTDNLIRTMRQYKETRSFVESLNMGNLMQEHISNDIRIQPRHYIRHCTSQFNQEDARTILNLIALCGKTIVKLEAVKACNYFWRNLIKMINKGLLPELQEVPHGYTCYCDCTPSYFAVVSAIGKRMNSMSLFKIKDPPGSNMFRDKKIDFQLKLPNNAMVYSHIKTLFINAENNPLFANTTVYSFGRFINKYFPSLETLTLELLCQPRSYYLDILTLMGLDLDNVVPNSTIRHFTAYNFIYSNLTTLYIMKKFPNLLSLNIISNEKLTTKNNKNMVKQHRLRGPFTSISPQLMFQYMDYIQVIPSFNVDNFLIPNIIFHLASYIEDGSFSGLVDIELQEDFQEKAYWKVPLKRDIYDNEVLPMHPSRRQQWQKQLAATLTDGPLNENRIIRLSKRKVQKQLDRNYRPSIEGHPATTFITDSDEEEEDIMSTEEAVLDNEVFGDDDEDDTMSTETVSDNEVYGDVNGSLAHEFSRQLKINDFEQVPNISFYPRLQLHNNQKDGHFFQTPGIPTMTLRFFMPLYPELVNTFDMMFRAKPIQDCTLEYTSFLKKSGHSIRHLRLSFTNPKEYPEPGKKHDAKRRYFNLMLTRYAHLYDGTHLAEVLKWCPNLKSITLNDSCLVGRQSFIPGIFKKRQHASLRRLNISDCQIPKNALFEFSLGLPLLRHLNLSQVECTFQDEQNREKYVFEIKMPHTAFRSISYYNKQLLGHFNNVFYVRVETIKCRPIFLVGDSMGIKPCSGEEYYKRTPHMFAIKIFCERLKELVIRFNEHNYKRYIFNR